MIMAIPQTICDDGLLRLARYIFAPPGVDEEWFFLWLNGPCGREWATALGLEVEILYREHADAYEREKGVSAPPLEFTDRCPGEPMIPNSLPRLAPHEGALGP